MSLAVLNRNGGGRLGGAWWQLEAPVAEDGVERRHAVAHLDLARPHLGDAILQAEVLLRWKARLNLVRIEPGSLAHGGAVAVRCSGGGGRLLWLGFAWI